MKELNLMGDRRVEYGYLFQQLPKGQGLVLDLGPSPKDPEGPITIRFAIERGWNVIAVGLEKPDYRHPRYKFVHGDFLTVGIEGTFDWIMNISTIEHFGLAGRYGVHVWAPDADLKAMRRLRTLMKPKGKMILTIPVGLDTVVGHYHRVYGKYRLPRLLEGLNILHEQFWGKPHPGKSWKSQANDFISITKKAALGTRPLRRHKRYYAIGAFTLELES